MLKIFGNFFLLQFCCRLDHTEFEKILRKKKSYKKILNLFFRFFKIFGNLYRSEFEQNRRKTKSFVEKFINENFIEILKKSENCSCKRFRTFRFWGGNGGEGWRELANNQEEDYQFDRIPFVLKGNGNIFIWVRHMLTCCAIQELNTWTIHELNSWKIIN